MENDLTSSHAKACDVSVNRGCAATPYIHTEWYEFY